MQLRESNHCILKPIQKTGRGTFYFMEVKPGLSALVTGGGAGIGKALSLALAKKGIFITIVDFSEVKGKEVASLVEKENAKFHPDLPFKSALFIKCDVTNAGHLSHAFKKHFETYGGLDICVNSAGVVTPVPLHEDQPGSINDSWRHTMNVNIIAVIDSTRLASGKHNFILGRGFHMRGFRLSSVADAVEYLHSGKSVGKVVVCMDPSFSQQVAKLL